VTVDELNSALLAGAAVLLVAVVAVRLSVGTGMPSLLLYLLLGVAVGEDGFGVLFDDFELAQVLGYSALALILAEGGLTTRWSAVRSSMLPATLLATVGTAVSVGVVAVAAHYALGMAWTTAALVGAVVSSTDAAAVFSVLRQVPLPRRLVGLLEAESGLNDAPVVLAVVALTESAAGRSTDAWWLVVVSAGVALVGGGLIGGAVGWAGAQRLRGIALPSVGLYPIAVMALCGLAYGAAAVLQTSGFIAVYVCGLVLGNASLPHRQSVRGFAEGLGWLAQIGLFVMLGLLVSPSVLLDDVGRALLVGAVLLLAARPLSVLVSVAWFRFGWREQVFLSWAGLRGAVPIVLGTFVLSSGIESGATIFNAVFFVVVVSVIVQGTTLEWVAQRLGLISPAPPVHDAPLELGPLSKLDLVDFAVAGNHAINGAAVRELGLPRSALIAVINRGDDTIPPRGSTVVQSGDRLFVLVPRAMRADLEDVFSRWRRRV
jgi:potassium/hydrogen antiporter